MIVTICADDYGLTPAVSAGILECLSNRRISATSCMTGTPHWPAWAAQLKPYLTKVDIGLHFTLTDQRPLGPMPDFAPDGRFPRQQQLLRRAVARRLPLDEIRDELTRQLDAFEQALGTVPAHVDGHHHVQQLPGVRDVLVATLSERYGAQPPYLRASHDRADRIARRSLETADATKAFVIGLFGPSLRRTARRRGLVTNAGFGGIYGFDSGRPVRETFLRFLECPVQRMLIMCHPGRVDAELHSVDQFTEQRERELEFLLSEAWISGLGERGLSLGRLS